jgi:hypothetical protein
MKLHAMFRSAAATVLLATAASAQSSADFDRLIGSGFSELRVAAALRPSRSPRRAERSCTRRTTGASRTAPRPAAASC